MLFLHLSPRFKLLFFNLYVKTKKNTFKEVLLSILLLFFLFNFGCQNEKGERFIFVFGVFNSNYSWNDDFLVFFFSAFFLLSYFLYTSVVLHVYLPYAYCIVTNLFLCTWAYMCRFFDPKTLIASWAVEIGAEESSSRCSVFAWSSIRCPELLCCNLVQTINPPWFYLSMIKYFQALWKHSLNDVISNFCSVFIWLTLNHAVCHEGIRPCWNQQGFSPLLLASCSHREMTLFVRY